MLFRLTHDSKSKYTYVYRNKSLLGLKKSICDACGRSIVVTEYSAGDRELVLDRGKEYPDYLQYCDAGNGYFLLSHHAIEVLLSNCISGIYKTERVLLIEQESYNKSVSHSVIPVYENTRISGRAELHFEQMFLKKKNYCSLCGQFEWNRKRIPPLVISSHSWDGSDLCIVTSMPGEIVCSKKFVEIVRKNKLSGFSFEEIVMVD